MPLVTSQKRLFKLSANLLKEQWKDEYLDQKCHLLATLRTATHGVCHRIGNRYCCAL